MERHEPVRLAIIGLGFIGRQHLDYISRMDGVKLAGICDRQLAAELAAHHGTRAFTDYRDLLDQARPEAVLICVPHFDHVPIAIEAFSRGIHVLCEKPLAVTAYEARKALEAWESARTTRPDLRFGLMFMKRTNPAFRKIKDLLDGGELGRLSRVSWINTEWFRTQTYYDSGDWRATWAGEGGGLLTNQCPHDLDIYQWLFGLPERITAQASLGKHHDIEVEDEVTAYFEHENGMIGHFIASTGESPGTNRLEIVGEHGKLVCEPGSLIFYRNRQSMRDFCAQSPTTMEKVECWRCDLPLAAETLPEHQPLTANFLQALRDPETSLIAPGGAGLATAQLANGIMLSSFKQAPVALPFDEREYQDQLDALIRGSRYRLKSR